MNDGFELFAKSVADKNLKNTLTKSVVNGIVNIGMTAVQSPSTTITVIDALINVIRETKNISSALLEKRVLYFLYSIKDLDIEKRHRFINKKIRGNEETFAEVTFIALERMDRLHKAKILANIITANANNIDDDIYLRLLHSLTYVYYDDLLYLKELYDKDRCLENYRLLSLSNYGLLNSSSPNTYGKVRYTYYTLSNLGILFLKYGIDVENCEKYVLRSETDEAEI